MIAVQIILMLAVTVGMSYAWWLIFSAERDWEGVWRQPEDRP